MPDPIPCRDAKGNVVFQIGAAGRLRIASGRLAIFERPFPKDAKEIKSRLFAMVGDNGEIPALWLESISRSLADDSPILAFRVEEHGDYLRCHADGTWDLWRPAGTRVERAYVGGGAR